MAVGSYAIEKDYSHYIAYAAKTILAVVGTATKGPVGVATVCTSTQDLVNKFGPLKTNCYGLYAGQYFLSQSSKMYFVRAASESSAPATAKIDGATAEGTSIKEAITLSFKETGTYYNEYTISVSEGIPVVDGEDTVDTYDILIRTTSGNAIESIKGLKLSDLKVGYSTNNLTITSSIIPGDTTIKSLTTGEYTFSGGNDGIDDIDADAYINAAASLIADTVDMNLFAVPGVYDESVITAMLTLAETRGDCLYLVDPPKGLTRDEVVAWHNGVSDTNNPPKYTNTTKFNSSYGALYYDWVTIYDSVNKVKVDVPPSIPAAATIAYSDRLSDPWYAPAGLTRGIVRGVLGTATKLNKTDIEYIYSGTNCINSLYEDPQVGLVIWGQKTLYRESTALDRINVRRLLNYLKRIVTAACSYLTFEPNDRITWNSFEMKVIPTLESIKNNRGIYEYRIVKGETIVTDDDIDNYRMPCMIMIRPTKAAEEIPIYFVITSTGADFNEVLEANGVLEV